MTTAESAQHHLILISGAVASGKSTLAWRLAGLARGRAVPAAAIDMDELVAIVAGRDWLSVTSAHRRLACELAATIAERLFNRGARFVAIAGSTVSSHEWRHVLGHFNVTLRATQVLLRVSLAEAQRRAQADILRTGATRSPDVVARLHVAIDWSSASEPDIEMDTEGLNQDEVATAVWARLQPDVDPPA